jgi:hypothetical protein
MSFASVNDHCSGEVNPEWIILMGFDDWISLLKKTVLSDLEVESLKCHKAQVLLSSRLDGIDPSRISHAYIF